jgi:hypothetical protein
MILFQPMAHFISEDACILFGSFRRRQKPRHANDVTGLPR